MEISNEKINDLNKSNDILAKWDMVKKILLRSSENPELKSYFNEEFINKISSRIIVCKDEETYKNKYLSFINKKDRNSLSVLDIPLAFTNSETNLIYIKPNTTIEVITHEVVHGISNLKGEETGIVENMKEFYKKNDILDYEKIIAINSLNEAATHFITQKLIPEIKINDGYNYGADILDKYYQVNKKCGNNYNKIFESYFNKNQEAFNEFANDFNVNLDIVIDSIATAQYIMYFKNSKKILTEEEINTILLNMKDNFSYGNKPQTEKLEIKGKTL